MWIITSDHGEEFMEHQHLFHAHSLFEEVLRVPFIVVYSGKVSPGQRIAEPIQSVDLFRTIAELGGLPDPPSASGRSFAGRLTGGSKPARFSKSIENLMLVERIQWRGIIADLPEGRFKWTSRFKRKLFDLAKDPGESTDVASQHREILKRLSSLPAKLGMPTSARVREDFNESRKKWKHLREKEKSARTGPPTPGSQEDSHQQMLERLRAIGYVDEVEGLDTEMSLETE